MLPLADWPELRTSGGNVATNKANRQTIPASRLRDRWMIAEDYR